MALEPVPDPQVPDMAKVAFEAYCESVGGQTHDGKPIPAWEDLTHEVRSAWHAAAQAVALTLSED